MGQDFNFGGEANQGLESDAQGGSAASPDEFMFEDEKKPVNRNLIALLLIIAVGGGGLYFMYQRGGLGVGAQSTEAVPEVIGDETQKKLGEMRLKLDETSRLVKVLERIGDRPQVTKLKVNPFLQVADVVVDNPGAAPEKNEALAQALRDVQGLQVQSVMALGENSTCVINKTLLKTGEKISVGTTEFTVERIEASREGSRVILAACGQRFTRVLDKGNR